VLLRPTRSLASRGGKTSLARAPRGSLSALRPPVRDKISCDNAASVIVHDRVAWARCVDAAAEHQVVARLICCCPGCAAIGYWVARAGAAPPRHL